MPPSQDEIITLVRSGRAPDSAGERLDLAQKLRAAQEDIDRCQRELDRLQNVVKAVEIQKQLFSSHRDRIHSIIASPIRKLPSEMLLEIFNDLCAAPYANRISDSPVLRTMVLSQVCIRWYNLVHDTPALWSKFAISGYRPKMGLVASFLERSRSHPLDFNFDLTQHHSSEIATLITTPAVSDRWRQVQLLAIGGPLEQALLKLPGEHLVNNSEIVTAPARTFPELISLHLARNINVTYPMPHCPKLYSLTLDAVHLYRHHSSPHLTSVRKLQLDYLTPSQTFHILESCPNAEDVSLGSIRPSFDQPLPHLICSHIRKLELKYDEEEIGVVGPLSVFLNTLTTPALTHLKLIYNEFSIPEVRTGLFASISSMHGCSMIGVSSAGGDMVYTSVTHLCLASPVGFSDLAIRGLFAALPCVTQFEYIEERDCQDTVEWVIQCLIAPWNHAVHSSNDNSGGLKEDGNQKKELTCQDCLLPYLLANSHFRP